jgi:hypothetical protein
MRCVLRASAIVGAVLVVAACDRGIAPGAKPGEFLITTLSAPPGHSVTKTFGFYCRWFTYGAGADYGAAFTAANVALKTEAEKMGANAFINWSATVVPPTDAKSTAGSLVMLCGDFAGVK